MIRNIIFAAVFLIIECFHASGKVSAKEIIPLKEGNWWKYSYTIYREEKVYQSDTLTLFIESKKEINNSYWYKVGLDFSKPIIPYSKDLFISNKADGLWMFKNLDSIVQTQSIQLLFRYPTFIGDESAWKFKEGISGIKTVGITKIRLINTVGEHECIEYQSTGGEDTHFFVCPGIGLMKFTGYVTRKAEGSNIAVKSDMSIIVALIDYKIN